MIGPQRRAAILDALRRGTVPREGLDAFAVGMERFEAAVDQDLAAVAGGRSGFKAVRGEYGSGKTFFARWLQERARALGATLSQIEKQFGKGSVIRLGGQPVVAVPAISSGSISMPRSRGRAMTGWASPKPPMSHSLVTSLEISDRTTSA